jgi:hypothetical protein
MLVSRGTVPSDGQDLKADASIAFNRLKNSDRYNTDKQIIQNLTAEYPPTQYDYFMTGHSLGGATTAQLKRELPFIKDAVVYNPASQPWDFISQQSDQIKRIYTQDDPLYALGGETFTNKQVIPTSRSTIGLKTGTIADYGSKAYNFLQGHALDNFNTLYGGYFHRKGDGTGTLHNAEYVGTKRPPQGNMPIQFVPNNKRGFGTLGAIGGRMCPMDMSPSSIACRNQGRPPVREAPYMPKIGVVRPNKRGFGGCGDCGGECTGMGNIRGGRRRADAVNAYLANQLFSSPLYTDPNFTFDGKGKGKRRKAKGSAHWDPNRNKFICPHDYGNYWYPCDEKYANLPAYAKVVFNEGAITNRDGFS